MHFSRLAVKHLPETEFGASILGFKQDPYLKFKLGEAVLAQSSYKDGAGSNAEWGDETLQFSIQECAVMEECRMKIEVWNENAPAPDTLVSEYFVPLEDICGVQEEEFDFKVDLFRRRKKKAFQFANRFFGRGKQTNESTGATEADEAPDGVNVVEPSNSLGGELAESLHLPRTFSLQGHD